MDTVNKGNCHFNLSKSSLQDLIQDLGGEYKESRGEDWRTLDRDELKEVQKRIWPLGEGTANTAWAAKKRKYKEALGYLAETLFDLDAADALLVGSYKTGWAEYLLTRDMKFVTSSGANTTDLQKSLALSGRFASEVCIPQDGLIGDWAKHKLVFAGLMKTKPDGSLKSAGGFKTQGFGPNTYCFARKAGTRYYCKFDISTKDLDSFNSEIAFPDDVKLEYIKPYPQGKPDANAPWLSPRWDEVN
jgi:hypothetical protein